MATDPISDGTEPDLAALVQLLGYRLAAAGDLDGAELATELLQLIRMPRPGATRLRSTWIPLKVSARAHGLAGLAASVEPLLYRL